MNARRAAVGWLWLSAMLTAQAPTPTPTPTPSPTPSPAPDNVTKLHTAWIKEILDLDIKGAVADYEAVAADNRPSNHSRWIAVTRLAELSRMGIPVAYPGPAAEAPPAIRAALALLTPLPMQDLLRQAAADPELAPSATGPEGARLPDLRPATSLAQQWVRKQLGPNVSERQRQRFQALGNRTRPDTTRQTERDQASDIMRREIEGKLEQAANLRWLYFPEWKPPTMQGDAATALVRVRANLDAWLKEPTLSRGQTSLLRTLREALDERAATDAGTALALITRLPLIAERLLGEPSGR